MHFIGYIGKENKMHFNRYWKGETNPLLIPLCNAAKYDKYTIFNITADKNEVNCKNCIKQLNKDW